MIVSLPGRPPLDANLLRNHLAQRLHVSAVNDFFSFFRLLSTCHINFPDVQYLLRCEQTFEPMVYPSKLSLKISFVNFTSTFSLNQVPDVAPSVCSKKLCSWLL